MAGSMSRALPKKPGPGFVPRPNTGIQATGKTCRAPHSSRNVPGREVRAVIRELAIPPWRM